MDKRCRQFLLLVLLVIFYMCLVQSVSININSPTSGNLTQTENRSVIINYSIISQDIREIIYIWNNTNYSFYNSSLIFFSNFNNLSNLGENDSLVYDLSKVRFNGTTYGNPVWNSSGKYGGAYQFDGIDDFIVLDNRSTILAGGPSLSISAWIKPNVSSGKIILKRTNGGGCASWDMALSSRKITFGVIVGSGSNPDTTLTSQASVDTTGNTWTHVVITFNNVSRQIISYINGTYDTNKTSANQNAINYCVNSIITTIGALVNNTNYSHLSSLYAGQIDDLMIWNRTLSEYEVQALYYTKISSHNYSLWNYEVNQTKNISNLLDYGNYSHYLSVVNSSGFENSSEYRILEIIPDVFAPNAITGLMNESADDYWIYWNWTNPTLDFYQNIIYLDGANIANTSNSSYNATNLAFNTSYTIKINTMDVTGNINYTNVTSTTFTWNLGKTFYVDYENGDDSNTGRNTSLAWKHSPGDGNATGNANATSLRPGDIVIFKGGVIYRGQINITSSGNSNGSITYDGNSNGSWGTGKSIISYKANTTVNGFEATALRNFIVIKNFEFYNIGGYENASIPAGNGCTNNYSSAPDGGGIKFYNGGTNLSILDCYFHEIGNWNVTDPFDGNAITGVGINLQDVNNVFINNSNFSRMGTGISLKASQYGNITNIDIANVDISHYIRWGVDIAPRGINASLENITIRSSKIHDYYEYDSVNWLAFGGCMDMPHTDGIFMRADYSNITWRNNKIYRNLFYNSNASQAGGGTAAIYVTEGPSVEIYNNLFINTLHGRTIFLNDGPRNNGTDQVINIYHNTFFNKNTAINLKSEGNRALWNVSIKNNLFYDWRSGDSNNFAIHLEDQLATYNETTHIDYNLYRTRNTLNSLIRWDGNGGEMNLSKIQTNKSWELHGLIADPNFTDISLNDSQTRLQDLNLHLLSISEAIDRGINVSVYSDYDGNVTRPDDGDNNGTTGFDIGAYEFLYDSVSPSVTINNPGNTSYSSATVSVNISLNEQGLCLYSLDLGATNNSLTNSGNISFNGTTSSLSNGAYQLWAYCNDTIGNINNSISVNFSVVVSSDSDDSDSSSGSGGTVNTKTFSVSANQLENGYTNNLGKGDKILFNFDNVGHSVTLDKLDSLSASLTVRSSPITETFFIGEKKLFELNNDSYYDLSVLLNGIKSGKANITLGNIHEFISGNVVNNGINVNNSNINESTEGAENVGKIFNISNINIKQIIYILLGIGLIILIVMGIIYYRYKQDKHHH